MFEWKKIGHSELETLANVGTLDKVMENILFHSGVSRYQESVCTAIRIGVARSQELQQRIQNASCCSGHSTRNPKSEDDKPPSK